MILARATASERKTLRKVLQLEEPKKPRKYGNKITYVDDKMFHSKKEARRYVELKLLEDDGRISHLELQPKFVLHAHRAIPIKIGSYIADFQYRELDKFGNVTAVIVEDVKGAETQIFRWKKKHVEAEYGIKLRIT